MHCMWSHVLSLQPHLLDLYGETLIKGGLELNTINFLDFTQHSFANYQQIRTDKTQSIFFHHILNPFGDPHEEIYKDASVGYSMLSRSLSLSKGLYWEKAPTIVYLTPFHPRKLKKHIDNDKSFRDVKVYTIPHIDLFPYQPPQTFRPLKNSSKKTMLNLDFIESISYIKS